MARLIRKGKVLTGTSLKVLSMTWAEYQADKEALDRYDGIIEITDKDCEDIDADDIAYSDTTTVKGAIDEINSNLSDMSIYSTSTDKVVGKWIDGRNITRRVHDLGSNVNIPTTSWYQTEISNGIFISAIGVSVNGSSCPLIVGTGAGKNSNSVGFQTSRYGDSFPVRYIVMELIR